MLSFLFRGLTTDTSRGAALFDAITGRARDSRWYIDGSVPDTIDGRFAVLATLTALVLVRFEDAGPQGNAASVMLTERFIAVMESEHRELGLGDPTLGKTVRKLVGSLARRTELWRSAVAGELGWAEASGESLFKGDPGQSALRHVSKALQVFWGGLQDATLPELEAGKVQ